MKMVRELLMIFWFFCEKRQPKKLGHLSRCFCGFFIPWIEMAYTIQCDKTVNPILNTSAYGWMIYCFCIHLHCCWFLDPSNFRQIESVFQSCLKCKLFKVQAYLLQIRMRNNFEHNQRRHIPVTHRNSNGLSHSILNSENKYLSSEYLIM